MTVSRREFGMMFTGATAMAALGGYSLMTGGRSLITPPAPTILAKAASGYPRQVPGFDELTDAEWAEITSAQWKERLSPRAFSVLRQESTERAFTSPLNHEKREGWFACAGCGQVLFSSDMKYDSGTGWPSFFDVIPGRIGTKPDNHLWYTRTEYHCSRCGGHQGHVFDDGPRPTGQRWCNNGVALVFAPATELT